MSTKTFYPDANPEVSSVDGHVAHYAGAVGDTWANIRNGAGTHYADSGNILHSAWIQAANSNLWVQIKRGVLLFDTSSLTAQATIISATLSIFGSDKDDQLGCSPDINVYASAPVSNIALEAGDYDSLGIIPLCDIPITYANWSITTYNNFLLNTVGLAAISKTGVTKLGLRNANYDVANVEPTWVSGLVSSYLFAYQADKGVGFKPKLVIVYHTRVPVVATLAATGVT